MPRIKTQDTGTSYLDDLDKQEVGNPFQSEQRSYEVILCRKQVLSQKNYLVLLMLIVIHRFGLFYYNSENAKGREESEVKISTRGSYGNRLNPNDKFYWDDNEVDFLQLAVQTK